MTKRRRRHPLPADKRNSPKVLKVPKAKRLRLFSTAPHSRCERFKDAHAKNGPARDIHGRTAKRLLSFISSLCGGPAEDEEAPERQDYKNVKADIAGLMT